MLRGQVLHSILYYALHAKYFTSQIDPPVYLLHNALKTQLKRRTISNTFLPVNNGNTNVGSCIYSVAFFTKHFWHIKV